MIKKARNCTPKIAIAPASEAKKAFAVWPSVVWAEPAPASGSKAGPPVDVGCVLLVDIPNDFSEILILNEKRRFDQACDQARDLC